MLDNEELGRRIRIAIEESPTNQAGVALAFGVTVQAVNGWIRTGKIDKRKLPKLANITRKPLSFFLPEAASTESQPAGLDLETLRSAIVAVKESLRKAELELDAYVAAPVIAFAYRERAKLPRALTKAQFREFDATVWKHLQGELADDAGHGRSIEAGAGSAKAAAPKAAKAGAGKARRNG